MHWFCPSVRLSVGLSIGCTSKIVKSSYLNEKSSDFDEIWYTTAHFELNDNHVTKYKHFLKFKMADVHCLKSVLP